jgi:tetratricopeptide (TPR) repeat protein/mono/diheme cytochrome c family protein
MTLRTTALLLVLALPARAAAQAPDQDALARKAHAVLKANCYRCHGQDGANEGGVNYVLDARRLVERRKVLPGNAAKSRLIRRVTDPDDPMPPEGEKARPGPDDIAALRQWIDAGAPPFTAPAAARAPLTPADVYRLVRADLAAVGERDRRYTRYLTLAHLRNAGLSEDELQSYRHALAKLVNCLSWGGRVIVPRAIDPDRTVFRIDLRDYQWDERTWEAVLAENPYGVAHPGADAKACCETTGCRQPCVRGDWFVAAAARPPLYHEILRLPATEAELERLLRVDTRAGVRQEKVARAGFNGSGVSRNNRLIERHEASGVIYWKSYDFAGNVGRQNLFAHPLGPGDDDGAFRQDGGEIIFTLPNGLHAYFLADGRGRRLDKGPVAVVSDPRRPDRAVENGVSCMSCHARGLIDKPDQVREHVRKNPGGFAPGTRAAVLALYPPRDRFAALVREDSRRFREAVAKTGAPLSASEPVVALALRFEAELGLPLAAAEAGVTPAELLAALERSPRLARQLGPLRVAGGTVQRQAFVSAFPEVVRTLKLGAVLRPLNSPAARALALGEELLGKKDLDGALKALTAAVEHDPDNVLAYLIRGDVHRARGDLDKALADFSEAVRLDPDAPAGFHRRAAAHHDRGELDRALADYSAVLRLDPKDAVAHNNRGLAHFDRGDLKSAIADYSAALRLDPEYAVARNNRGLAHAALGQHDRAIADYAEAIRLDPKYARAYHNRGAAYLAKGEYERAVADYSEALKLNPRSAVAYNNRGLAHYQRRDYGRAVADFTEAIRLDGKFARAYYNRALAQRQLGNADLADADRATALRLDPSLGKE